MKMSPLSWIIWLDPKSGLCCETNSSKSKASFGCQYNWQDQSTVVHTINLPSMMTKWLDTDAKVMYLIVFTAMKRNSFSWTIQQQLKCGLCCEKNSSESKAVLNRCYNCQDAPTIFNTSLSASHVFLNNCFSMLPLLWNKLKLIKGCMELPQ